MTSTRMDVEIEARSCGTISACLFLSYIMIMSHISGSLATHGLHAVYAGVCVDLSPR